MKQIIILFLILFSCNSDEKYSKEKAMEQYRICYELYIQSTSIFNERNEYVLEMNKLGSEDSYNFDKSIFSKINLLTKEIAENNKYIDSVIRSEKVIHYQDNSLFHNLNEHFDRLNSLEVECINLLKDIEDGSINDTEKDYSTIINGLISKMTTSEHRFRNYGNTFIDKYDISEEEQESLLNIAKSKKRKILD